MGGCVSGWDWEANLKSGLFAAASPSVRAMTGSGPAWGSARKCLAKNAQQRGSLTCLEIALTAWQAMGPRIDPCSGASRWQRPSG